MQEEKFLIQEEIFLVQYGRFLPGLVRPAVRASKPLVRSSVRLCDNPESCAGVPTICASVRGLVRASGHSVRPSEDLCARNLTCARRRRLVRKFGTVFCRGACPREAIASPVGGKKAVCSDSEAVAPGQKLVC